MLEALAGRTLASKPLLVVSPKEPERTQQEYSGQRCRDNEKEATDGYCRRRRRCCLLWGRYRTSYRWVEASDDEVWSSADCDVGDDSSSGDVEHKNPAVGESHETELPITGDSDRLRGTVQAENPRWFLRRHSCARRDRSKDIQLVVLPIRHIDLASVRIIIH